MSVSDGSPMKHAEVSEWSSIRHVGLRKVSDYNDIFLNSVYPAYTSTRAVLILKLLVSFKKASFCNEMM